jgi:hypothetical protein
MDEDRFNISIRKFLKEVGVTSQREIERVVRDGAVKGTTLRLRMTLTSPDAPLEHVVETTIELTPPSTP